VLLDLQVQQAYKAFLAQPQIQVLQDRLVQLVLQGLQDQEDQVDQQEQLEQEVLVVFADLLEIPVQQEQQG
jgi:hypothetical protein